jgi:hypothetical protein
VRRAAGKKQAILNFHDQHPLEGYRRLTFMMLDADVVGCSPASVYRVLKGAGLLERDLPAPGQRLGRGRPADFGPGRRRGQEQ